MLRLIAFWHRFLLDFLKLRTLKIELPPRREHDFHKIDVFEKGSKNHWFWLHFWKPNRRKFDKKSIRKTYMFSTSTLMRFLSISVPFWAPKIAQKSLIFEKSEVRRHPLKHYSFGAAFWMDFEALRARFWLSLGPPAFLEKPFPSI